jgi:hypothetical protein
MGCSGFDVSAGISQTTAGLISGEHVDGMRISPLTSPAHARIMPVIQIWQHRAKVEKRPTEVPILPAHMILYHLLESQYFIVFHMFSSNTSMAGPE